MAFQFHSTQVHETYENGAHKMKKNSVDISNGKGTKTVEVTENGKTRKVTHKLTPSQITKVKKNQFIPGLFNSCHNCLNKPRSSKTQTRRATKKKGSSRK